jgi:hypothetical protein
VRRRHADRPDQIGGHGIGHELVVDAATSPIGQHDAGIVDQDVETGMLGDQLRRHGIDARRIGDVEFDRLHAGIGGDHFVQIGATASGDDHLVAELVEGLGEPASNARTAAGDEDGVACEFHGLPC